MKLNLKDRTLFFIAFIILTLAALAFLLIKHNLVFGWVLCVVWFVVYLIVGMKFAKKGCLTQIIIFVIAALAIITTCIFTIPKDSRVTDNNTGKTTARSTAAASISPSAVKENPAFKVSYLSYAMWPDFSYVDAVSNNKNIKVTGDISFTFNGNPAALKNPGDKVAKITMSVKTLKNPIAGTVHLYRFRPDLSVSPQYPADKSKYLLPETFNLVIKDAVPETEDPQNYLITYYNQISRGQIRIYYCIDDIMPEDKANISWQDNIPLAISKGYTSDSLRTNIGIELIIELTSGEKHRIYFEREMMKGDFFSKTRLSNIVEDYQSKESTIVSTVVK